MMNRILDLLSIQPSELLALDNWLFVILFSVAQISLFYHFYSTANLEFINFTKGISVFDRQFAKKLVWYFFWALIQQCIVLIPLYVLSASAWVKYGASVAIFTVLYHFGNWRLMLFTGIFSSIVYACWYFLDFNSLVLVALLHALGGTLYYYLQWEMRVWQLDEILKVVTRIKSWVK